MRPNPVTSVIAVTPCFAKQRAAAPLEAIIISIASSIQRERARPCIAPAKSMPVPSGFVNTHALPAVAPVLRTMHSALT